jgi:hypothetical protein
MVAAAGVPIDTIVSRWQAHIRGAERINDTMNLRTAMAWVLWMLLLIGLAARSSRWR